MKAIAFPLFAAFMVALAGCESTPVTSTENMGGHARETFQQMVTADSGLQTIADKSYAYVVFPEVGAAAIGVGGAGGKGVVYQGGREIGTATLNQGSVGVQLGGETYSELVIFDTPDAFDVFRDSHLEVGADMSATIVKAGAAAAAPFNHHTRIFVMPRGGLMAGVAIEGQFQGAGHTFMHAEIAQPGFQVAAFFPAQIALVQLLDGLVDFRRFELARRE